MHGYNEKPANLSSDLNILQTWQSTAIQNEAKKFNKHKNWQPQIKYFSLAIYCSGNENKHLHSTEPTQI